MYQCASSANINKFVTVLDRKVVLFRVNTVILNFQDRVRESK